MKRPLISIIVCTYNRAHLLSETMESLFNQDYRPVEIIVLDDGSTDETESVMATYGDKVRYYRQDNQGVAAARTAGLDHANGEYIAFHDDDDLMAEDRLASLYEAMLRYPEAVLAVGDHAILTENGNHTRVQRVSNKYKDTDDLILFEKGYQAVLRTDIDPIPQVSLFRKKDGERIGWFDNRFFHGCEDTDFFARIAQLGPVVYVPKVMAIVRKNHQSLMKNYILMQYCRFLYAEKHLKLIPDTDKELSDIFRKRLLDAMTNISYYKSVNPYDQQIHSTGIEITRGLSQVGLENQLIFWFNIFVKNKIKWLRDKIIRYNANQKSYN